jgi:ABC-type multidrug transport system fused ATPase/permease subunit
MGLWGGAGMPGGWSNQTSVMGGPGQNRMTFARGLDGWTEDELGQVVDPKVVRRLFPYLLAHGWLAWLAFFAVLSWAALYFIQPLIIGKTIDAIHRGSAHDLNVWIVILLVVTVGAWIMQWTQLTTTGWIGHKILLRLRTELFDHLQKLSLSFYDRHEVGRIMSRATSDVAAMQELMSSGLMTVLGNIFGLVIVVFALLLQDWVMALVTFAVVPFLVYAMNTWQKHARDAFIQARAAIAVVNSTINEDISGVRVIQSLSRENENSRRFGMINNMNLDANIYAARLAAAVVPMVELSVAIGTSLVIVVGGVRVSHGWMTVGTLIAFVLYVQRFFDPIRDMVLQYTQWQRAMAGGERILEVLDTKPEIVDAPDAVDLPQIEGRVDFEHMGFSYVEGVPVLQDINLHVEPGETIAFVGQTGAGKSTMTSLLARLYEVTEGSIKIDGYDLRTITRKSLARQMGVVLQDPYLFSGTIRENIRFGNLNATDEQIEAAAQAVGAHDFIMRLEKGYDTELHERGGNISVGQRQLLSFARAVVADPRILVLDEATANVDTQTEIIIQRALRRILRGRTSFVIAHRLSTIRDADRVIVLDHGRIVEQGNHNQLLELDGIYAKFYKMAYQAQQADIEVDESIGGGGLRTRTRPATAPST